MKNLKLITFILGIVAISTSLSGCLKEKIDLEELLQNNGDRWDIVDQCSIAYPYQFSYIEFNSDRTGVFQVYRDCEVGYECKDWITFRWTLHEDEEEVSINWRTDQTIQICEEIQDNSFYIAPERFGFNTETERISVRGYTFEKD